MSVERSRDFIIVALYLSRCGRGDGSQSPFPPAELETDSWAAAYAIFFDALGAGRSFRSFHNSLKATRDQFDSHVDSGRRGWWVDGVPKPLPDQDADVLDMWRDQPDLALWQAVEQFADRAVASIPKSVLSDLEAESDEDEETVAVGREGKARAVVSKRRERNPRLRAAALAIHGHSCQVCGFNFERAYGSWGKHFAEVHHIMELGSAPVEGIETDPATDLAVLCANCHRMVHRRLKQALRLDELRVMMEAQAIEKPKG